MGLPSETFQIQLQTHPKIREKKSCLLRVEESDCLIGGRVVPIVTRAIHHVISAARDGAPPPARGASPEAHT